MNPLGKIITAVVSVGILVLTGWLGARWWRGDKRFFAPDTSTAGHYQIEQKCQLCHTPFRGVENESCLKCHDQELKLANDSHAPSKFVDPRNAASLAVLDVRECRNCHHEHRPAMTHVGGVTQPADHCFACHADIASERPSHANFSPQNCSAAGCHKYHDNRALYEDFIAKHLDEPDTAAAPRTASRDVPSHPAHSITKDVRPLSARDEDSGGKLAATPAILREWENTAHARAGVNCSGCHALTNRQTNERVWLTKPGLSACRTCHDGEAAGFVRGRHGMRIAQDLPAMRPALARQPMKSEAAHKELSCASCHSAHEFDPRRAAVDSCLSCHNDRHSAAYKQSPHFRVWQAELSGNATPNSGVSCATCHLPREHVRRDGVERTLVQHNQNANLRPNEKMIRTVCLDCHGLAFSIDALADTRLWQNNFTGRPSRSIETVAMVRRRLNNTNKNPTSETKER